MPLIYSGQEAGLDKRLEFFEKDLIDFTDKEDLPGFIKSSIALKQHPALQSQERDGSMSEIANNHLKSLVF